MIEAVKESLLEMCLWRDSQYIQKEIYTCAQNIHRTSIYCMKQNQKLPGEPDKLQHFKRCKCSCNSRRFWVEVQNVSIMWKTGRTTESSPGYLAPCIWNKVHNQKSILTVMRCQRIVEFYMNFLSVLPACIQDRVMQMCIVIHAVLVNHL